MIVRCSKCNQAFSTATGAENHFVNTHVWVDGLLVLEYPITEQSECKYKRAQLIPLDNYTNLLVEWTGKDMIFCEAKYEN